jgi:integrase
MVNQNARYIFRKRNVFYFSRRIPKDLLKHYSTKRIVISLRTKNKAVAKKGASIIAGRLDDYWMSLRISDLNIPVPIASAPASELQALVTLSQALESYQSLKGNGKDDLFFKASNRFIRYVIEELGDRPINNYSSLDAARFRDSLFQRGLSSSSVRRAFASIRSVINLSIKEYGLEWSNAFAKTYIPKRDDTKKRAPLSVKDIQLIQMKCRQIDDDVRWLIALLSDSGMRLAEAAGLLRSDILLDRDIPHIDLVPHPWRQLKTGNSKRKIPLVGQSLWACQRILENNESPYSFPRYVNGKRCNANSASAALNKWMKPYVPEGCVVHSFRHSFRDRLRALEAPMEVTDTLGGWSTQTIGQTYGKGYELTVLSKWMRRIVIA